MAVFDWMFVAQEEANEDPAFRALGSADTVVFFQSGKHVRRVTFEAFQIESVTNVGLDAVDDCDILINMTTREWNSYLFQRRHHRAPSLLALDAEKKFIKTKDTFARLAYERFSRTIQAFVDYGASASGQ